MVVAVYNTENDGIAVFYVGVYFNLYKRNLQQGRGLLSNAYLFIH
jgi:hypothetical protein